MLEKNYYFTHCAIISMEIYDKEIDLIAKINWLDIYQLLINYIWSLNVINVIPRRCSR